MSDIEVRILGPIEAVIDGATVPIPGERQRATLALLALTPRQVVSVDRVIDALWGDAVPANPQNTVQIAVSRLRGALGEAGGVVVTRTPGYVLDLPDDAIDALRLELLVEQSGALLAAGDTQAAAAVSSRAVALRRGEPLGEFRYANFATDAAARIDDLYVVAQERQADAALAWGQDPGEILTWLEPLARAHPHRERLWALLMLGLYRVGRQAEALATYHEARRRLEAELGIDPSPALRDLEIAILNQDAALVAPPGEPAAHPGRSLPAPATPLVGRDTDLAHIAELLAGGARVITLTGPGGVGKSRLALGAAAAAASDFRDGAVWVPLAAVEEAALVPAAIATATGLPDAVDGRALLDGLAAREVLLVLDTLEHLLGSASLLGTLLARAPDLRILATSRFTLRLGGEHEVSVEPLASADAVEVFLQRARAADPGFVDDGAVADVCRELAGLPLALELAAARVKLLSPREIADRLAAGDDVLADGPRDADPRQASMRAAIAWSWGLLPPEEQACLARLSVFPASFAADAALAVGEADMDLLAALLDRSLVRRESADGGVRLTLLPGVRTYALDRLDDAGEEEAARRRLAEHVVALAERAARAPAGDREALVARLERDAASVRSVISWAATEDAAMLARLAAALGPLFTDRLATLTMLSGVRRLAPA